jgi:hypothetical protein
MADRFESLASATLVPPKVLNDSSFLSGLNNSSNRKANVANNISIMSQAVLLQIMFPENEAFSLEFSVLDLQRVRIFDEVLTSILGEEEHYYHTR